MTGVSFFNDEHLNSLEQPLSWGEYLLAPDFWNRTLQNWPSEFLAVGKEESKKVVGEVRAQVRNLMQDAGPRQ